MKLRFILLPFIAIFIVSLAITPSKARASDPSDVSMNLSPANPSPNENVNINLTSYVDDLNSFLISWSVNGKSSLSGIGKKTFSLTAPSIGQTTTVTAIISLPDGDLKESATIKPTVMNLLWQATNSYVPPFYQGKALPGADSEVKVVAIPEIKSGSGYVNPANMVYSWSLDGTNQQNDSGYGKNYYSYVSDYLDGANAISVTSSTTDQNASVDGSLTVPTFSPKIEFYKKNSTLGTVWEQALTNGYTVKENDVLVAAPYFISPQSLGIPFLTFNWYINDQAVSVPTYSKNILPLRIQSGTSGVSRIGLEIENTHSLVNAITKAITVKF